MKPPQTNNFGGDWTSEKLKRVEKYLTAYATIMNKQHFSFAYIDAFAGTGYWKRKPKGSCSESFFPELADSENREFVDGSARIALKVEPRFQRYLFIEKSGCVASGLEKLRDEFPEKAADIMLVNAEANSYLQDLCGHRNWSNHRAVLFLDPYGMQVEWKTIEAIAKTEAIDLWLLFPLGVAVNRLLKRDGKIDEGWRKRLNLMFGEEGWYDIFYKTETTPGLFGEQSETKKIADFKLIGDYFNGRLKTVFQGVAKKPLALCNSKGTPLYLLCFAAANPKGAKTAVKIAQDILGK